QPLEGEDVAVHGTGKRDRCAVHADSIGNSVTHVRERLAKRRLCPGFRIFTPEERGELLARVSTWLEREVCQESNRFGAQRARRNTFDSHRTATTPGQRQP